MAAAITVKVNGKPVGICGEAAADPLLAVVLVGLGVSWELLGLSRPALSDAAVTAIKATPGLSPALLARADRLGASASSQGSALAVSAVVGLHF